MRRRKWLMAIPLMLAELALCAGIVYLSSWSVAQVRASGIRVSLFRTDRYSATADEEQRVGVAGPATLTVENTTGNIAVVAGPDGEVAVLAHKTAWGNTPADAQARLDQMRVIATQDGNAIAVRVEEPEELVLVQLRSGIDSVDLTLTVPAGTRVTARTRSGNVSLAGTSSDAELKTAFGEIEVSGLSGGLTAETSSGRITVRQVRAGAATVDLTSDFGEIVLEESGAGEVKAHSGSGSLRLEDVEAARGVTLSTDFGAITVGTGQAETLSARSNSGAIELSRLEVSGALSAQTDFGDVRLTDVRAASYDLSTNSGDVTVDGAAGPLKAQTDFGDIEVRRGREVRLEAQTGSGSITFEGSLDNGPHEVVSDFGSIRLALPADAALTFDLSTDNGRIVSDLPVTLQGELEADHWNGEINGGGAQLVVATNGGDIALEILNP